jgi:methyltransferase
MVEITASHLFFFAVLLAVVAERLWELAFSARNARATLARGGVVSGDPHHWSVVGLHVLWLAAGPLEVVLLRRPWIPGLATAMVLLLVLSMTLRYWSVRALGDRWNVRIIVVPGEQPVTDGPFRWFRHPSYTAAFAEFVTVPLVHTAWLTAFLLGPLNMLVMWRKIRAEEQALRAMPEYRDFMKHNRPIGPGRR